MAVLYRLNWIFIRYSAAIINKAPTVKIKIRFLPIAVIIIVNLSLGSQAVFAQGEHSRRAATEIRVISGDIRRFQASNTSPIQKIGLKHRIQGGLAALDILLRLADQETGKPVSQYSSEVSNLATLIDHNEYLKAKSVLDQWEESYPLRMLKLNPGDSNVNHKPAKTLHQELCAACHDNPAIDVERPAYNLFDEAKNLKYSEFLARLFVGVRGDRVTGIDNPLSDYEILALLDFYSSN